MYRVGILSFQGDFERHRQTLDSLGAETALVRSLEDLDDIEALVIPGGESTTIGKLMVAFGVHLPVRERILAGMPVFGTCAGLILLGRPVERKNQHRLGVMDIEVERNAYGRQVDSFETDVPIPLLGESPVRGVFIRAPVVTEVGDGVEVLAELNGNPVLLRENNKLAATFHPELTTDTRVHEYFLSML